jgi:IS605 OrfB family transposase
MERFNEAASFAAKVGFEAGVFSQPSIHKRAYAAIRTRFGLSAQLAVRAIGKAVECFRRDKTVCPIFQPRGAITYDERILSFKGLDKVSLWTLKGRLLLPLAYGAYQKERFDRLRGQVDLVYRSGKFYLYATVELPAKAPIEVQDFLGVDLGIANLATDSDGHVHTGEGVERVRRRRHESRRSYQKTGTKNAKRRLKRMARREANYRRNENHRIANQLVQRAKDTGRGIGLEDLSHIRDRTTVRAKDRAKHSGWAFAQLQAFIVYKATLAGVPVVFVDARNTSRICPECGHCAKANRKSQAEFECRHCGHSDHADRNAARNVRERAIVKWLDLAASDDPGLRSRAS